ncbi:MAG: hypothetical protein B7X49_17580 [Acidiphilium sp. 34-64-41]|nr:MAG: hypothetical protein B7X49_17580 [Acidiphilium sp. 34-64-41]
MVIKHAYDPPEASDGKRILVDRLWPRGLARAKAGIDLWLKDIAPSTKLRKEFDHDPARWSAFVAAYSEELAANPDGFDQLLALCHTGPVTLLFAARDTTHNNAVVLAELLSKQLHKMR